MARYLFDHVEYSASNESSTFSDSEGFPQVLNTVVKLPLKFRYQNFTEEIHMMLFIANYDMLFLPNFIIEQILALRDIKALWPTRYRPHALTSCSTNNCRVALATIQ